MQGLTENASLANLKDEAAANRTSASRFRLFFFVVAGLSLCFARPLFELGRLAFSEEIHSHILLIPFISLYLFNQRRTQLPKPQLGPIPPVLAAALLPAALLGLSFTRSDLGVGEILSLRILAFWMLLLISTFATLGVAYFRSVVFLLCFLLFAVPLPPSIIEPLETASKIASTEVYSWMMDLTQSTYLRNGFVFALPGLSIEVAQECSGIRSSLVLFIVSVLASNLFLTTTWRRILFCLFVIPLGVFRNGFRIFTLSFLSVQWDRSVIDSPLHHKGGPIFFAISLIPFCLVLAWLRRSELRRQMSRPAAPVC